MKGAGDAILLVETTSNRIVDANANAVRRLGYTREELLGLLITDIEMQSEKSEDHESFRWESIASGVVIYECHCRRRDESLWPTEISISYIKIGSRTLQLNVIRDITERKEIEQQRLAVALERQRVDILADFISNVSHEFKTPLAVINTGLYLLEKTLDDNNSAHERLVQVNDQVLYINHLIDAMLTMSQLDSRAEISFVRFDLNEILREIVSVTRPEVEENQQRLEVHLSETPLIVLGVKDDLYLALHHLTDNALTFTPAGGTITVASSMADDMALIEVADTGVGISEKDLPRIFERFFRADEARTERRVGLGLSMCKKVVDIHAGHIKAESVPDEGSRFSIWLPLLDE